MSRLTSTKGWNASKLIDLLKIEKFKHSSKKTPISGKLVMFTGGFADRSRSELKSIAESLGAKIASSITRKTDFLVAGSQKPTIRKINEAKSLNIKVLSEEEWNKIVS